MTARLPALIVSSLLLAALPSLAAAQTTDPAPGEGTSGGQGTTSGEQGSEGGEGSPLTRPFRGLFGLGDDSRTGADVSGSVYGAYDKNLGATLPGQERDPRFHESGWYAGGNTRFSLNWRGERSSANGWAGAAANYYPKYRDAPGNRDPLVPTYSGGIGVSRPFGERNNLSARFLARYSPYYLSGFFPEVPSLDPLPAPVEDVDPGLDVSGRTLTRYSTVVELSRRLTRKATLMLQYGYILTDYNATSRKYTQHFAAISFRRQLRPHLGLRLGYRYRRSTNTVFTGLLDDDLLNRDMHDIDAGLNYSRSFTLASSRRTTLGFSTGSSFYTTRRLSDDGLSTQSRTHLYANGTVTLAHEMGRTWSLAAVYSRNAGFSELVFEPVTSDSASASLSGLIGRRDEISFRAS